MSASAAPTTSPKRPFSLALPKATSMVWLYAMIALLAAMHLSMVTGRSINWDEFWFYSQVETVARGEFIQPLQTIHTRAFAWWLPEMGGTSVDHIQIARFFMLACLAITSISIVIAAEKFSDRRTALFAAAAYLGAGFVLHHGTAFRVDPIVTACLASGFAIAARSRLSVVPIVVLGALIGLAAMVTIKMVLWLPAFAGIALYRWEEEGFKPAYALRWIAAGVTSAVAFGLLYLWHSSGMVDVANEAASGTLGQSADRMIGFLASPHLDVALKGIAISLPLLIAAALVPWVVAKMEATRIRKIALLAIWFPLLTPVFYYNSYPYFYAFILPPVAIACALSIPLIIKRYGQHIVASVILLSAAAMWFVDARGVTGKQQQLAQAVDEVFPEPVSYFDCCGMIASFDKANEFRTTWGVDLYLKADRPLMLETMRNKPVPLLVDNNREFSGAILGIETGTFHPQDIAAMRSTYIRHWGDIWIAGRNVEAGKTLEWEVLVPGPYAVAGSLEIGGTAYSTGDVVELPRGPVTITNIGAKRARLVWGERIVDPAGTPPEAYWTAF